MTRRWQCDGFGATSRHGLASPGFQSTPSRIRQVFVQHGSMSPDIADPKLVSALRSRYHRFSPFISIGWTNSGLEELHGKQVWLRKIGSSRLTRHRSYEKDWVRRVFRQPIRYAVTFGDLVGWQRWAHSVFWLLSGGLPHFSLSHGLRTTHLLLCELCFVHPPEPLTHNETVASCY